MPLQCASVRFVVAVKLTQFYNTSEILNHKCDVHAVIPKAKAIPNTEETKQYNRHLHTKK